MILKTLVLVLGFLTLGWAGGGTSPAVNWTDPVLTPNETPIKAVHITELRNQINVNRAACGLPAQVWTDDPIVTRVTPIKKIHMDELRTATTSLVLADQRAKDSMANTQPTPPAFTDPYIYPNYTVIRAAHISEIRNLASNANCSGGTCAANSSLAWVPKQTFWGSPHPHNTAKCDNTGGAQVTAICDAAANGQLVQCCDSNISIAGQIGADCIQYRCECAPVPPAPATWVWDGGYGYCATDFSCNANEGAACNKATDTNVCKGINQAPFSATCRELRCK